MFTFKIFIKCCIWRVILKYLKFSICYNGNVFLIEVYNRRQIADKDMYKNNSVMLDYIHTISSYVYMYVYTYNNDIYIFLIIYLYTDCLNKMGRILGC